MHGLRKIAKATLLLVVVVLVAATAAQARPSSGAERKLHAREAAFNRLVLPVTPAETLQARNAAFDRLDLAGRTDSPSVSGSAWSPVALGILGGLGLTLVAGTGVILTRTRRLASS